MRWTRSAMGIALVGAASLSAVALWALQSERAHSVRANVNVGTSKSAPPLEPDPGMDPVFARRSLRVLDKQRAPGVTLGRHAGDDAWVDRRPAAHTQRSLSNDERGVNPCSTPEPELGMYSAWQRLSTMGGLTFHRDAVREDGAFDLVLHFNGHEPARKEVVRSGIPIVFWGATDDDYYGTFSASAVFESLLGAIEELVAEQSARREARIEHLVLSAWSRGYEAIARFLTHFPTRAQAVVLLDGLHATRGPGAALQLEPFIDYARRARANDAWMLISHSSIDPPTFASTTETAHALVHALGGRPSRVEGNGPYGMELIEAYSAGNFHVRGYAGHDKPDHCAHLALMPEVLQALVGHWQRNRLAAGR